MSVGDREKGKMVLGDRKGKENKTRKGCARMINWSLWTMGERFLFSLYYYIYIPIFAFLL